MFNTLETYHFQKLPQSIKDKAEKMIDDVSPLGILYEGTIDAVKVWGRDDILLLMQAMYNEVRKEESVNVAESSSKTFPRVNKFNCGSSYRH